MFPLDYVLAVALLTSGAPNADAPVSTQGLTSVRPALQALAVSKEVLDARETRYVLTQPGEFGNDLKLLRRRYCELTDAPPLEDCFRFPDRATINDLLAFNRAYRQHLDNRQALEQTFWWELREAVQETERLYQIWDTVRDARCDYYYVTVRRQALKKLRETLGEDAYWTGTLPPHVPVWRFARID
jgi:hypothetical protein